MMMDLSRYCFWKEKLELFRICLVPTNPENAFVGPKKKVGWVEFV